MYTSPDELRALQRVAALEPPLAALEDCLDAMAQALCRNDAAAIESRAAELHRALARAIDHFTRAARQGGVPAVLRQRLAMASGQVAAQREALARAMTSLDRAIDVLLPEHAATSVYGHAGLAERAAHMGSLQA